MGRLQNSFWETENSYDANFQLLGNWENFAGTAAEANNYDPEQMTLGEIRAFFESEFDPENSAEIAPIIGLLAKAIPTVVTAIPGIIKMFKSKPGSGPQPQPATTGSAPQTSPVPAVTAPATPAAAIPIGQTVPNAVNVLTGLLQNPAIISSIQGLLGGNKSDISAGNSQIPVGSILGVVSQLAASLGSTLNREDYYYPDYYFDAEGNMLVDPESPESIGAHILKTLNG